MPFRIRYKLLIAFAIMLLPLLAIIGITHHTQKVLYRSGQRVQNITGEMNKIHDLQLAFDQVIMPGNDYIITGDKLHIEDFKRHAEILKMRLESLATVLPGKEEGPYDAAEEEKEQELIRDVNLAWKNINERSQRIFSISNPVGNMEAMRLMKEMDYNWAYPVITKLEQFNEFEKREYQEALELADRAYRRSWIIMIAASILLIAFAGTFAFFYSSIFVRPIITLHRTADTIAGGDFSPRLNIKTNDEVQQLSNAMNDMAERLNILYTGMEDMVTERTGELRAAKEEMEIAKKEWEGTFDAISDPIFIHDRQFRIIRANKAYSEAAGMALTELVGRPYFEVFPIMEGPLAACKKNVELQEDTEDIFLPVLGRTYKLKLYPFRDKAGEYLYSVHVMEDVTGEKKAVEDLKEEMAVTSSLLQLAEVIDRTLDVDSLMKHVVRISCSILGSNMCLSYLLDTGTGLLRPAHASGLDYARLHTFRAKPLDTKLGFVRKAFESREPAIFSGAEIHVDFEFLDWLPESKTLVIIPLIVRKAAVGLIIAANTGSETSELMLTDRLRKVVSGIMYQVSTAIEQSKLYREAVDKAMDLSYKIENIQVMNAMDRTIISSLKPHDILDTAVRMVAKVMPCDMAILSIVDRERKGFVFSGGIGTTFMAQEAFMPFEATSASAVVETGRLQYIANLPDLKEPLAFEKQLMDSGMASSMRVPLIVKGAVTGIFSINSKRQAAFTSEDLSVLEKMAAQICVAMENANLIKGLEDLFIGTVKSLSSAIDAKSKWTAGHSERVTNYALIIGRTMGFSEKELKDIELAGLLHDVGKIGTYEKILDKPEKLTDEELEIMKQHPVKGAEILSPISQLKDILPAIKHHHEFYDGSGYPDGLKGEAIHIFARILAVADSVDAMAADRPYRKGRSMDDITTELNRCSGTQFDPYVVKILLKTLEA